MKMRRTSHCKWRSLALLWRTSAPPRVAALQAIQAPASNKELQEFLGIATYMSPFIPNLSSLIASLRDMLKKEAELL